MKNLQLKFKTLYFEVTHACNQGCRHCYLDGGIHKTINEMRTEEITGIIEQFQQQHGEHIIITGGEPLVRRDCFEILNYIENLNIPFTLASNSLLMDEKRLEKISGYKNLSCYFTSLLGSNPQEHELITGRRKSFLKTMNALKFFDSLGITTYIQITLARPFVNKIYDIAESLLQFKNCNIKFTPIGCVGIKKHLENIDEIIVPEIEFRSFFDTVKNIQNKYPGRIDDSNLVDWSGLSEMIHSDNKNELYSLSSEFIVIGPNGLKRFSPDMENPFSFGYAQQGLSIEINDKLLKYIELCKRVDAVILEMSKFNVVEYDAVFDKLMLQYKNQIC